MSAAVSFANEAVAPLSSSSIGRLHDDELLSVLSFLSLGDLSQLVRCVRAFNHVASKERSRGVVQECLDASALPLQLSSSLVQHVSSLNVCAVAGQRGGCRFSRDALRAVRSMPRVVRLFIYLTNEADVAGWTKLQSDADAARSLRDVWPTQLHFLHLHTSGALVLRSFLLLLALLPADELQLTELSLQGFTFSPLLSFDALLHLPKLRMLTLPSGNSLTDAQMAIVQQLSELRELDCLLSDKQLLALCAAAPQQLQHLERLNLWTNDIGETEIRALMRLPSLTALQPRRLTGRHGHC